MGVAVPRALVGGWTPGPLKSLVTGRSLLVNRYVGNKFHKKSGCSPPLKSNTAYTMQLLIKRRLYKKYSDIFWHKLVTYVNIKSRTALSRRQVE